MIRKFTYDQDSWNHSYSSTQTDIVGCVYAIPVMDDVGTLRINGSTIKIKGTL